MKRQWIFLLVFGVVLILFWLLWPPKPEGSGVHHRVMPVQPKSVEMVEWEDDNGNPMMIPESELPEEIKEERRRRKEMSERLDAIWRTPIAFFGKVVDQDGRPVEKARIEYSITDMSPEGRTMRETLSEPDGSFQIGGVRGHSLVVRVSKEGYLQFQDSRRGFSYGGLGGSRGVHQPNPQSPEIFRLQRKGEAVPLVRNERLLELVIDGPPLWVDVYTLQGKAVAIGDVFSLSAKTVDSSGRRRVAYQIAVPGGGILPTLEEFPTMAPEQNYQESILVTPEEIGDYQYFFTFPSGIRGRLKLNLVPGSPTVKIVEAVVNPDGGRNLEYDPKLRIQVRTHRDGSTSLIYPKGYEPKTP